MIKWLKFRRLIESLLAAVIVGILIPGFYYVRSIFHNQPLVVANLIQGFIFTLIVTFSLYYINTLITEKFQEKEKSFKSQFTRLFFELITTLTVSIILIIFLSVIFIFIQNIDPEQAHMGMYDNIVIAIIVTLVCVAITELLFFLNKWKNAAIETEQLKRQNIETQYAALTSQVNPHFLFNSLNALSSLIQDDPEKALIFNREFAKIYRYVLDSKDKLVVTLQEELNFLNSYLYLQKIRFEDALQYKIEINYSCMDYFLPPLSLQLLVENSIKHNEVSEEKPLQIKITGEALELSISNNYQPILKERTGEGIGLKNLIERYSHYTDIVPVFKVEDNQYVARIPLLKDE